MTPASRRPTVSSNMLFGAPSMLRLCENMAALNRSTWCRTTAAAGSRTARCPATGWGCTNDPPAPDSVAELGLLAWIAATTSRVVLAMPEFRVRTVNAAIARRYEPVAVIDVVVVDGEIPGIEAAGAPGTTSAE